jgi:hypothetical protein
MAAATATTLSTFKSALTFGGARPSLFDIQIIAPSGFVGMEGLGQSQFKCHVSEIPGLTVTPIEKQYFGRTVKIPGELTFGTLSTTFYNTEKYEIRKSIEIWQEKLNGQETNFGMSGKVSAWAGGVTLRQYTKAGAASMTYSFIDCWPSSITAIDLNYDTVGDVETFDVTWEYNYYTSANGHTNKVAAFATQN